MDVEIQRNVDTEQASWLDLQPFHVDLFDTMMKSMGRMAQEQSEIVYPDHPVAAVQDQQNGMAKAKAWTTTEVVETAVAAAAAAVAVVVAVI